jgi:hypothetical protein
MVSFCLFGFGLVLTDADPGWLRVFQHRGDVLDDRRGDVNPSAF